MSIRDAKGLPDLKVLPFLKGMRLNKQGQYIFTVDVNLETTNETHYRSLVSIKGNVTSDFISYYRIEYMPTTFDDGSFFEAAEFTNTRSHSFINTSQAEPINFHAGVASFDIQELPKFEFVYPGRLDNEEYVQRIKINMFSYRKFHSCPTGKFYD